MKKVLKSKNSYIGVSFQKKEISNEILSFFNQVRLYQKYDKKCFSTDNIFESDVNLHNVDMSVAEWEWDTNEIYLDKMLIKRQYKKSILLSIDIIEKTLLEKFPGNSFVISFCIQFGRFRNINIRICQDLGIPILDEDLDKYSQPVMQVYLTT